MDRCPEGSDDAVFRGFSWLVSGVEAHLIGLLDYCRHLRSSAYPSPHPRDALLELESIITNIRTEFLARQAVLVRETGDPDLLTAGIMVLKARVGELVAELSIQLAKIRNSRFAIAPPYSLPFLDMQVGRIIDAFDLGIDAFLRRLPIHPCTLSDDKFGQKRRRVECIILPVFSGVEAQEIGRSWPFEFDQGQPLLYRAQTRGEERANALTVLWLFYFRYPLLDRNSVITLPLFYHEFGHLIIRASRAIPWRPPDLPLKARGSGDAQRAEPMRRGAGLTRYQKGVVKWHWEEELLADCLAVRLVGPAFVFALIEFATRGIALGPQLTHPPMKVRFQTILSELRRSGHDKSDLKELGQLTRAAVASDRVSSDSDELQEDLSEIEASVRKRVAHQRQAPFQQKIDKYLEEITSSECLPCFTKESFATSLRMADMVANHLVLPIAIYEPGMHDLIDATAVLNVPSLLCRRINGAAPGIEKMKLRLAPSSTQTPDHCADQAISRLVQKSLEAAYIQATVIRQGRS